MERWGEKRTAVFQPKIIDNLRPEAIPLVGKLLEFEFAGTMNGGPYDGQAIWTLVNREERVGWIPDEDLGV